MVVRNVVRSPVRAVVQSVFGEGESFHPFQLFTSGAQGAWYDPSDFSTLYQDAAGTTPVTAVEQPVRLMLDRSRGLVLGSELITNGGFDTDITGWTNASTGTGTATWSAGGASLVRIDAGNAGILRQSFTTVAGRSYRISYSAATATIKGGVGTSALDDSLSNTSATAGTTTAAIFVASGTTTHVYFIPVANATTAVLDNVSVRELPGNHAVAPNDASRPVLRARYNLLTYSQRFISPWNSSGAGYDSTITNNVTIAPDGTNTGSLFASQNLGGTGTAILAFVFSATSGTTYTLSFFAKANTLSWMTLFNLNYGANGHTYFDLGNGLIGNVAALNTATITSHANGWYRCAITFTATVTGSGEMRAYLADGNNDVTIARDGNTSVYIWGASLLTAADQAATGGAYQRVGAATDYDTGPPWRPYLAFDGSDDSMSTSSIDFSGTDKMTVFAGVSKLSDASFAVLAELSAASAGNNGTFAFFAPNPANLYTWRSRGTISQDVNTGNPAYNAPDTSVLTGIGDISGDVSTLRVDGAQAGTNTSDQGTGNYGNYPLFIGRRNNTNLPFNGRLYGLTVLGRTATAPELTAMESWIAGKTGVSL